MELTQNQIIIAFMKGCTKAKQDYFNSIPDVVTDKITEGDLKDKLLEWERWCKAVDVLNEVIQSNRKAIRK